MSKIRYTLQHKRMIYVKTPKGNAVVGEAEHFQQNQDGSMDLVVWIYPQCPKQIREAIEKDPRILGMTAEPLPIKDHMIFPDSEKFEEVDDPEDETMEKLRASIKKLESLLAEMNGGNE